MFVLCEEHLLLAAGRCHTHPGWWKCGWARSHEIPECVSKVLWADLVQQRLLNSSHYFFHNVWCELLFSPTTPERNLEYITRTQTNKQTSSQEDKSLFPSASSCRHTNCSSLSINYSSTHQTSMSLIYSLFHHSCPHQWGRFCFSFFRLEPTKQLSSPDPSQ